MEEGCGGEVEDAMVNIKGNCTDSKFHPKGGQRMAADPQGTPHPDTLQDTSTSVQGMKGPPATVDHPQEGEGPTQARRLVRITRRWFEGRAPGPRHRHPEGETQRGGRGGGCPRVCTSTSTSCLQGGGYIRCVGDAFRSVRTRHF